MVFFTWLFKARKFWPRWAMLPMDLLWCVNKTNTTFTDVRCSWRHATLFVKWIMIRLCKIILYSNHFCSSIFFKIMYPPPKKITNSFFICLIVIFLFCLVKGDSFRWEKEWNLWTDFFQFRRTLQRVWHSVSHSGGGHWNDLARYRPVHLETWQSDVKVCKD